MQAQPKKKGSEIMAFNTNKVRGLMAEHGLKQADIARVINKTEMTLRNKLQGKTEFTATEIAILANLFNVSPTIFFTPQVSLGETKNKIM